MFYSLLHNTDCLCSELCFLFSLFIVPLLCLVEIWGSCGGEYLDVGLVGLLLDAKIEVCFFRSVGMYLQVYTATDVRALMK
jgi:hypothetical protein